MDYEKQLVALSCLTLNRELLSLCNGIIKPSYFDPSLKKAVKFTQEYFAKYKGIPKIEVVRAETGVSLLDVGQLAKSDISYVAEEIETFCRNRAMTEAILAGPELLKSENYGEILEAMKTAISVGLQKDLGIDYFKSPELRMLDALENNPKITTGIAELDQLLGGGISRQELIMFAANSGAGKSMNMLNLAKNLLSQGLSGVYISLEMSEASVSKRLDSMITHISQAQLLKEITKASSLVENAAQKYGRFLVKRMPENSTTINNIRSYISQLEQSSGFKPDFIVVDYLDIMGTTHNISMDNLFIKDKLVTEEVRSLGFDYDCIMISASQLGRGAVEADKLNQAHIAGGISKINTSDYTIGIRQDDLQKAAGELWYECLKSRNSENAGKRVLLTWDPISLTITSPMKKQETLELVSKSKINMFETTNLVPAASKKSHGLNNVQNF